MGAKRDSRQRSKKLQHYSNAVRGTTTGSQQAVQPGPADDTYAGLDLTTRSPDYATLDIVKTSAYGITQTAGQVRSEASDYENITDQRVV
ncbi:hypothetical protein AALO_G00099170 [Alosa alosa]|uniref:Uncharacterized protein n=1 Tax=Alosa alosa TaxID=278164 RepID=A0AAV6GZK2_9TELE|nr:hypothetical protein AALO_G00099170 [Alosa alosa]